MAVSFDLFGTLVDRPRPADTAEAIARELRVRDVSVPDDWDAAGREATETTPIEDGQELSLATYVSRALAARDRSAEESVIEAAVLAAHDHPVETRPGAIDAIDAAAARGPVGVLSNCSVPGLVEHTIDAAEFDVADFDAVRSSVDLGWRKPHERAFRAIADSLCIPLSALVHVGDDPHDDGGANAVGATAVLLDDVSLVDFPAYLESLRDR